jgi:hypothetical protein
MVACAPPSSRGIDDFVRAIASAAWRRKLPESKA